MSRNSRVYERGQFAVCAPSINCRWFRRIYDTIKVGPSFGFVGQWNGTGKMTSPEFSEKSEYDTVGIRYDTAGFTECEQTVGSSGAGSINLHPLSMAKPNCQTMQSVMMTRR